EPLARERCIKLFTHRFCIVGRQIAVKLADLVPHWSDERSRIDRGAHNDSHLRLGLLQMSFVGFGFGFGAQAVLLFAAHYAYNRLPGPGLRRLGELHSLAYGVLPGKASTRKSLVDDDRRVCRDVRLVKEPPAE